MKKFRVFHDNVVSVIQFPVNGLWKRKENLKFLVNIQNKPNKITFYGLFNQLFWFYIIDFYS